MDNKVTEEETNTLKYAAATLYGGTFSRTALRLHGLSLFFSWIGYGKFLRANI
jgi:hypothetical protein